jgi:hypothetical protein
MRRSAQSHRNACAFSSAAVATSVFTAAEPDSAAARARARWCCTKWSAASNSRCATARSGPARFSSAWFSLPQAERVLHCDQSVRRQWPATETASLRGLQMYSLSSRLTHWATALLMVLAFSLIWLREDLPKGDLRGRHACVAPWAGLSCWPCSFPGCSRVG